MEATPGRKRRQGSGLLSLAHKKPGGPAEGGAPGSAASLHLPASCPTNIRLGTNAPAVSGGGPVDRTEAGWVPATSEWIRPCLSPS